MRSLLELAEFGIADRLVIHLESPTAFVLDSGPGFGREVPQGTPDLFVSDVPQDHAP
jgi:hypothetical protein